jgi:ectoine hydroxylase-related dioxygenase (phytanoyl-CoA dioxygenase family)
VTTLLKMARLSPFQVCAERDNSDGKVLMSQLNLITPTEEKAFRENGFLLLRSVISPSAVASLLAEVSRVADEANSIGAVLREEAYVFHENSYRLARVLRMTPAFDHLIDHPGYFGKLVSLIGPHIQLMGSEIFVRGAAHDAITNFHTDLGEGLQQILPDSENLFLQIKIQIFLTDLSAPDSGNFVLVPGSHRMRVTDTDEYCTVKEMNRQIGPNGRLPAGSLQVLAKPGDVLFFPHTLWHAVAPNRSGRTRYSIVLRYGQLTLRPHERYDPVLTDPSRTLTMRQRRLLGDFGMDNPGPYRPSKQAEIIYGYEGAEYRVDVC